MLCCNIGGASAIKPGLWRATRLCPPPRRQATWPGRRINCSSADASGPPVESPELSLELVGAAGATFTTSDSAPTAIHLLSTAGISSPHCGSSKNPNHRYALTGVVLSTRRHCARRDSRWDGLPMGRYSQIGSRQVVALESLLRKAASATDTGIEYLPARGGRALRMATFASVVSRGHLHCRGRKCRNGAGDAAAFFTRRDAAATCGISAFRNVLFAGGDHDQS